MNFPPERIVNVSLNHIIDATLLRALGLIDSEEDVTGYFVNGQNVIPLMIKLKPKQKEGRVVVHNGT